MTWSLQPAPHPGRPLGPAPPSQPDLAGHKNMLQLVQLRWLAVVGQLVTMAIATLWLKVPLPLMPMMVVVGLLVVINVASLAVLKRRAAIAKLELFAALMLDVAALTAQLYLSGGATNPFISLFLLQVVLGSVLLNRALSWVVVAATSLCFAVLLAFYVPLPLPLSALGGRPSLHTYGLWLAFVMVAVLLVLFVTRISENLRARDAYLADMRRQAVEADHIVRIGLLASGAAHELGTPLSSLSVILNDWRREPHICEDPQRLEELDEMQTALARCKSILTNILTSAGETRGEAPELTSVRDFLDELVSDWRASRPQAPLLYRDDFGQDLAIVSDTALKQTIGNVLDNAADASPTWIELRTHRRGEELLIVVSDRGPGFTPDMLENLGKPYHSTKDKLGGGLGLFLALNVMRKLGGDLFARNLRGGGAEVALTLPLAALALPEETPHER